MKGLPNVAGYDTLNEPSAGYIGEKDLERPASAVALLKGDTPTILQSMLLGSGRSQRVQTYDLGLTGFRRTGRRLLNPEGVSAWAPGREDVWRSEGVWDLDARGEAIILKPDHFARVHGRQVDFHNDYYKPFANRFARLLREIDPGAIIFLEGVPSHGELTWSASDAPNVVHAAHWYDDLTLVTKRYNPWMCIDGEQEKVVFGAGRVRRSFNEQIARMLEQSAERMNRAPALVGEVGIPFDMQGGRAYRTGDFSMQVRALDATMRALEENFASFTLWNYTSDNTNARGDQWNGEDLSLFSRDQRGGGDAVYDGGRALEAALRPYPCRTAGEPLSLRFDIRKGVFKFTFRHDPAVEAPTEIFIPAIQYPQGFNVEVSDGSFEWEASHSKLLYRHTSERPLHTLRLRLK